MIYIVRIYDINGMMHVTEDDEEPARDWLWRTLKRFTDDGENLPYGYKPQIEFLKLKERA